MRQWILIWGCGVLTVLFAQDPSRIWLAVGLIIGGAIWWNIIRSIALGCNCYHPGAFALWADIRRSKDIDRFIDEARASSDGNERISS
jgi:hypothetical protein